MAKRFVETMRWEDPWFEPLRPEFKLLYCYLCDKCDNSGVWNVNRNLAEKFIGLAITWDRVIPEMDGRIIELAGGKRWFLVKWLEFQYAPAFNPAVAAHVQARRLLRSHGIDEMSLPWSKQIDAERTVGPPSHKDRTGQVVSSSQRESPERDTPTARNRQLVRDLCKELLICSNDKAVSEWCDALQVHAKVKTIEEAIVCMRWAVNAPRDEGREVQYTRNAVNYLRQWPNVKHLHWSPPKKKPEDDKGAA